MRPALHGRLAAPAVAVVGVWDPFLASHATLLEDLRDHARDRGLSSLAVLLDPPPAAAGGFAAAYGTDGWPVYDGVFARVRLIRDLGVDAVLVMRFAPPDFDATAAQFLDATRRRVELAELWLGALQLLGPGPKGGRVAVEAYATENGIGLTMLPRPPVGTYDVRSFLASGRVRDAVETIGRPPTWSRPRSGWLRLSWRPGRYHAVAIERPGDDPTGSAEIPVALEPRRTGAPGLAWPVPDARYLAFVAGPAD
jgi:FAD synthase